VTSILDQTLLGDSPAMIEIRRRIVRIAASELPVLVEGETGTGKELVANALHALSGRKGQFVPVNMAAIPDALFESHVFGHLRGAFTGATQDHRGFWVEADNGTLLLDEISSAPLASQAKLLRALESRRIRPLGARAEAGVNARIVAATNVPLVDEVSAGRFRADLYYRLCGERIVIPPLRERRLDIGQIAAHYVARCASQTLRTVVLSAAAIAALESYDWPGNVRQLRTIVQRLVAGDEAGLIAATDVRELLAAFTPARGSVAVNQRTAEKCQAATDLRRLLEQYQWDTVSVAKALGVSRKTVYARITRFGLQIPDKYARRHGPLIDATGVVDDTALSRAERVHRGEFMPQQQQHTG
jgi:DNA-binding NtrC family response regulator